MSIHFFISDRTAGAQAGVWAGLPVLGTLALAMVGPAAGRWYADVTAGVAAKQFIRVRGDWFVGPALLSGIMYVSLYWLVVQRGGGRIWWATLIALAIGVTLWVIARYRGREERLAKEPAGVCEHDDGRPLLGPKIARKPQRELRDLGLLVESGAGRPADVESHPAPARAT